MYTRKSIQSTSSIVFDSIIRQTNPNEFYITIELSLRSILCWSCLSVSATDISSHSRCTIAKNNGAPNCLFGRQYPTLGAYWKILNIKTSYFANSVDKFAIQPQFLIGRAVSRLTDSQLFTLPGLPKYIAEGYQTHDL